MSIVTIRLRLLATCYSLHIAGPITARALYSISAPWLDSPGINILNAAKNWLQAVESQYRFQVSAVYDR